MCHFTKRIVPINTNDESTLHGAHDVRAANSSSPQRETKILMMSLISTANMTMYTPTLHQDLPLSQNQALAFLQHIIVM